MHVSWLVFLLFLLLFGMAIATVYSFTLPRPPPGNGETPGPFLDVESRLAHLSAERDQRIRDLANSYRSRVRTIYHHRRRNG